MSDINIKGVPIVVLRQFEQIRESAAVNMFDKANTVRIAQKRGFKELLDFMKANEYYVSIIAIAYNTDEWEAVSKEMYS